jgi:hypothetical protein
MKPALCLVDAYCDPGLPNPTINNASSLIALPVFFLNREKNYKHPYFTTDTPEFENLKVKNVQILYLIDAFYTHMGDKVRYFLTFFHMGMICSERGPSPLRRYLRGV